MSYTPSWTSNQLDQGLTQSGDRKCFLSHTFFTVTCRERSVIVQYERVLPTQIGDGIILSIATHVS